MIGAHAAVLPGVEIVTRDIDNTPATDPANLERLAAALDELHAAIRVRAGERPIPSPPTRGCLRAPRSSTSPPTPWSSTSPGA